MRLKLFLCFGAICAALGANSLNIQYGTRIMKSAGHDRDLPQFNKSERSIPWITVAHDGSLIITMYSGSSGSSRGSVFRYYPLTRELVSITSSDSIRGLTPSGKLSASSNPDILYGTTFGGGIHKEGTIYTVDLRTNTSKVVFHFEKNGPRHPNYGLIPLSDHEFMGVCDTTSDGSEAAQEPYVTYAYNGVGYIYDSELGSVTWFTPGSEYGQMRTLPVALNDETLVILFENGEQHHLIEYSLKEKSILSAVKSDFFFDPIVDLVRGRDSCVYTMHYYDEAKPTTYPFFCYDAKTNKCSTVGTGSRQITMYSGPFVIDSTGIFFAYLKMGVNFGNGLLVKLNPSADTLEPIILWPEKYDAVNSNDTQVTPGYDFISNSVLGSDGKLYAVSGISGLVSVDLTTRKVERLVRF